MSYRDEKDFGIFPTRTGSAQGVATERTMLDNLGGSAGIRTKIVDVAGGKVRLRTRNGMPEFVTESVAEEVPATQNKPLVSRTFVFSDYADPTAAYVAGRVRGNDAMLRRGVPIEARSFVSYSVLGTHAPTKAGYKAEKWKDVLRMDSYGTGNWNRARVNAEAGDPEHIAFYGERTMPGFFMQLSDKLYEANDWILESHPYTIATETMGVIEHSLLDGSIANFHGVVMGDAISIIQDHTSAIYKDTSGAFHFNWYSANPALYPGQELVCHTSIQPVVGAAPVIEHHQTVVPLFEFDFSSIQHTPQATASSDTEVGTWAAVARIIFSGATGPLNVYGFTFWMGADEPAEYRPILVATGVTTWASSIDAGLNYSAGFGIAEVAVDARITGSESWRTTGGSSATSDGSAYYRGHRGNNSTWSRTTDTTCSVRHVALGVDLYNVAFSMQSDLDMGQFEELTSATFDYSRWDRSPKFSLSGYSGPDAAATAVSHAQVTLGVALQNASMVTYISNTPPDFSGAGYGVTYSETYASPIGGNERNDHHTFSVSSRDYIFADFEEEVFLWLEGSFSDSRTDRSSPPIPIDMDGGYGTYSSELTIAYVLAFRGVEHRWAAYHGTFASDSLQADITLSPEWCDSIYEGQLFGRFSLSHFPDEPSLYFTPSYTRQDRCPWMAYTTKAEEAAGATPELYIDASFLPGPGSVAHENAWLSPMLPTVEFAAHHLNVLIRHLTRYAPADFWTSHLFPMANRIQFATGLTNPWPEKIGAPFDSSSHVTITRI